MQETKTLDLPILLPDANECSLCIERLRESLARTPGIDSATISDDHASLHLAYDPEQVTIERLEREAAQIGVELGQRIRHETLGIVGMDCPDCALKLEKGVKKLPGVLASQVNFAAARMWIEYEPDSVGVSQVVGRIESLGYGVESEEDEARSSDLWSNRGLFLHAGLSGAFLLLGHLAERFAGAAAFSAPLFALSILSGGYPLARTALGALKAMTFDTDFLMLVAAMGAAVIGQWAEGAMVIFLFSLGNSLESLTVEKTRKSIRELMDFAPQTALKVHEDHDHEIPIREIQPGDRLRILPGAKIPADGSVISGHSSVSEAAITGESMPSDKSAGDPVFAGALNGSGSLIMEATRRYEDSTLSRIIHLVEEAQAQKAPSQRFTERFGRIYTPSVITAALLTGFVWPFVVGASFTLWFHRALTFLVVACPCALVISIPVAVAAAIGRAARQGVLSKGGAALEALGGIRCVAFDKTGTLTTGEIEVTELLAVEGISESELLRLTAATERHSEHPLAKAVLRRAGREGVPLANSEDFDSVPGRGAEAILDRASLLVGNRAFMEERGVDLSALNDHAGEWLAKGKTVIWTARDGALIGALATEDAIRPESREALNRLRQVGVSHVAMITGDDAKVANAVADQLGIEERYANALPEQKANILKALMRRHGDTAMAGDGVNDAPSLALATVGIAMGAAGSDVALETADFALMSDDLNGVAFAVALSKRMRTIIRQNLLIAFGAVFLLVGGIFFNRVSLTMGVLGHEGSALLVILNGMRLLKK
jgi:Cd2+/Zn2+-exporting ATPase